MASIQRNRRLRDGLEKQTLVADKAACLLVESYW
jgi:hypothetical protein